MSTRLEAFEQSFTTEPKTYIKRGFGTVRNKCIAFISLLTKQGITSELPLDQAIDLFQMNINNTMDRTTVKAYFGTMPGKSRKVIQRLARYQSTGTMSFKTIELTQNVPKRRGYFERLGLCHYEKRVNTWFLVLDPESPMIPEMGKSATNMNEDISKVSIDNFSLTLKHTSFLQGEEREKPSRKGVSLNVEMEQKNNNIIEGERNRLSESNPKTVKPKLTALEEANLRGDTKENG